MFGPHLMLDCYGCDKKKLKDEKFILNFLNELPKILDMNIIKGPFIIPYENNPNTWDSGGVSAIVLIAESHIGIHTFPDNDGFMSLDLFSCRDFDIKGAISVVKETFSPKKVEKHLIMRGKHFPKEEYALKKIMDAQREKISEED